MASLKFVYSLLIEIEDNVKKIKDQIEEVRRNSEIIEGSADNGCFIPPTLVIKPPLESKISTEETFGPVMTIHPFKDDLEVIKLANSTGYGLSASIFGKNTERIKFISKRIRVGSICINDVLTHYGIADLPFGGLGLSGIGKVHGKEGLRAFSTQKSYLDNRFLFRSELIDISYPIFMLTITFLTGLYFRFVEENRIALANLQKEAKLLKERELAGEVQKSLFPDISKFENFIYATNVPARDVSGDYFDVVNVNKNEYFFTLADVSGKGIKAGMYMAKASSIFRTLSNLSYPLEKIVFGVNNELVEAKFKGMFVTAVFGKFNIDTSDVTFVNAGHESIMVFDRNKNFEFLKSEMPPIGIIKYFTESMVKSKTINLKEKTFVVYTDGVTEGYLKNGQELGAEGVQKIVTRLDNITPKNIVDSIANELNWGAEKLRDDITCLALDLKNTELVQLKKKKKQENKTDG